MSRIPVLIAYAVVFTIAGCGLPLPDPIRTDGGIIGNGTEKDPVRLAPSAPSDMKLRVYTGGDSGLTGTGAPDDPLRLTGSYIENRAPDAGAQNASLNVAGSGHFGQALAVDGNVAIGTPALDAGLKVLTVKGGGIHVGGTSLFENTLGIFATNNQAQLYLGNESKGGAGTFGGISWDDIGDVNGEGKQSLHLWRQNNSVGGNDQIVLTASGVGIGTRTPEARLHVSGVGATRVTSESPSGHSAGFTMKTTKGNWDVYAVSGGGFAVDDNTDMKNAKTRLVIDTNGNVGVGTPQPASRLHVTSDGGGGVTGIVVDVPGVGARRIMVGPLDSGGPGYRILHIVN